MSDVTQPVKRSHQAGPTFTGYPLGMVKLSAYAFESAEMLELPPVGQLLYVHSLCWCRKHGTYTFTLADVAGTHSTAAIRRLAGAMVAGGLWRVAGVDVFELAMNDLFIAWPTRTDSVLAAEHRRRRSLVRYHHRAELLERDGHKCGACLATGDLTIDHITPITKGGTDDLTNLRVLCRRCNSSKKDRIV